MTSYVIGEVISTNNVEITFVNVGQGDGAVIQVILFQNRHTPLMADTTM